MAIGLRIKFAGGTQEQYDAVHAQMGIEADPPEGLIFHAAGPIEERLGRHRLLGVARALRPLPARDGWARRSASSATRRRQGPPDIKEFPVHHFIKP